MLPDDQDKLLKKYNEIDHDQKSNDLPEEKRLNIVIIILSWILTFLSIFYVLDNIHLIVIAGFMVLIFTIGLYISSYKNKIIGSIISTVIAIIINIYVSVITLHDHSDFNTLVDGLGVFVIANLFGRKGFYIASFVISIKMIILYIVFPDARFPQQLIATIINANTIGITPLLLTSIGRSLQIAEKQKIRAQILLSQNQDLVADWKNFEASDA